MTDPSATTTTVPPGYKPRTWPEEIDDLLAQTHHPDPKVRRTAVHGLCPCAVRADYPEVWDRLIAMVDDEDPKVRADVFHTLCDGSPRSREADVVRTLERMHDDPDPKLRRRVRKLLANYRAGGKVNIL
jgi:hypothetical protein